MATITRFEELEVWQLAKQLYNKITPIVNQLRAQREYRMAEQMRSSSGSIMDNIAEGFERAGNKDFKQFLIIAKGSNGEFRSQLYRCLDRKYITKDQFDRLYNSNNLISAKILSLINYLQKTQLLGESRKTKDT